ncbi:sensor histidine kinase [Spirosoma sp. KNUC1025]|uniref:sensor histidine kinase n=1 Tax=Spirosoma sp. KNUC1025 TaxID=2894082 RepID=UPI0038692F73|nr:histidine kinase [Spirosoma sp. KNUC1025]
MTELYQRELLQSQIEIQNHTLQQIAQELHDNIGQLLTVAVMRLNTLEDEVQELESQRSVQQTRELLRTVISDVRALSKTLDYDTVQRFGLLPSLTLELERIQHTGRIQAQLITSGETYSLGDQAETVLLRMAQESINNVLKHASASNLTVSVLYKPDCFVLTIADDGKGFNVGEATARTLDQAGAGLNNLHRRTRLLGGACRVDSNFGEGTRIEIQLPRNQMI